MAAAKTSIQHRRQVRELEAKRDRLLQNQEKTRADLATVRTQLKHVRKVGAK